MRARPVPPRRPARTRRPARALRAVGVALLSALVAGGLVCGPVPAAQADRLVHRDAQHDVRQTREGRPGSTVRPRRREPDVTRVRVSYTPDRLRLQVRLRGLSESRNQASLVQIVAPGFTAGVYVTRIPSRRLMSALLIRGAGRVVDCPGLEYRMFFPKRIIKVVVPISCLDDARWVRVGFAISWTTTVRALSDDAFSARLGSAANLTRRLHAR